MNSIEKQTDQIYPPIEIQPHSLIPEFNALGNHPKDIVSYIDDHVQGAFERLGISDKYPAAKEILFNAAKELSLEEGTFTGHHTPNEKTEPVLGFMLDNFIDVEKCGFSGRENYELARKLTQEGNNVLVIQNHISPVDIFVPLAITRKEYNDTSVSVILSQVFEYARITNLIMSGLDKFPVFQPKHMKRFENQPQIIHEMCRQNSIALKSLVSFAREGGKMIYLYPEKNRNNRNMGVPEPGAVAIPELLSKSGKELYLLPTFITGLDSVFPNFPGRNELDDYFEIIKRGQGDFYCGTPVKYSDITRVASSVTQEKQIEIINKVVGQIPESEKDRMKALISSIMLGIIAKTSPDTSMVGVYNDEDIKSLVNQLDFVNSVQTSKQTNIDASQAA